MYSYAVKRIIRGKGLFIALFLSVALASTLFSGIIQGSDSVAVSIISSTLSKTKYDSLLVASEYNKNVTTTRIWDAEVVFGGQKDVSYINHFVILPEVFFNGSNTGKLKGLLVGVPDGSEIYQGISGITTLEDGKLYPDVSCANVTMISEGSKTGVTFETYNPTGGLADFHNNTYSLTMSSQVTLDDQTYALVVNQYNIYLNAVISGSETVGGRPLLNVVLANQNTVKSILNSVYGEKRRPVKDPVAVVLVRLDRNNIINPWDIPGTQKRVSSIITQLNSIGAPYYYVPKNYLGDVLDAIYSNSSSMKISTLLVMIPVFFTAWYLGLTISDVSLSLRRREIGLLLTRGVTHRQVLVTLLLEGVIIGLVAGLVGIIAGAAILPLVIPGLEINQILGAISPTSLGAAMLFSLTLAFLAVYRPATKATSMDVIEALREYRSEEEELGSWQEPMLALFFGVYKLLLLLFKINIQTFQPTQGDFILNLLYTTWYGIDYILGYIWPILLFYGITQIFILYIPWFPRLLSNIASHFVGDVSYFIALSSRRNLKRTMAYIFMATLIISYSFQVIGNSASTTDFLTRSVENQNGSDVSVVLYNLGDAQMLSGKIKALTGVESTAIEVDFQADSLFGYIGIRAIDIQDWNKTVYTQLYNIDKDALKKMGDELNKLIDEYSKNPTQIMDVYPAILDRGAAKSLGITSNSGNMNIKIENRVYTLRVVGLFGRDVGDNWTPLSPTVYMPSKILDRVNDKLILQVRILAKLKPGVDTSVLYSDIKSLSKNIQRIDYTSVLVDRMVNTAVLAGPRHIEELGVLFAALVAALGVWLVVSTQLRSRKRELSLMAIRGLSPKQLLVSLLSENLGMAVFATIIGVGIGYLSLSGQSEIYNNLMPGGTGWRLIFTTTSILMLLGVLSLIIVATSIPIFLAVKQISANPIMESEEY